MDKLASLLDSLVHILTFFKELWRKSPLYAIIAGVFIIICLFIFLYTKGSSTTVNNNITNNITMPDAPKASSSTDTSTSPSTSSSLAVVDINKSNKDRFHIQLNGVPIDKVETMVKTNDTTESVVNVEANALGYMGNPIDKLSEIIDRNLMSFSTAELKKKTNLIAIELRNTESKYIPRLKVLIIKEGHGGVGDPEVEAVHEEMETVFNAGLRQRALAIRNEILRRLRQPVTFEISAETQSLEDGQLEGSAPMSYIASALEMYAEKLPENHGTKAEKKE